MERLDNFRIRILAGYGLVVVLLGGGMVFAVTELQALARAEIADIRSRERQITLVERLRWSGEAIVAAGRGYLLSGDARLLARLQKAEADFDSSLRGVDAPETAAWTADVRQAAARFEQKQRQLILERSEADSPLAVARRFEVELLPRHEELMRALNALVRQQESALEARYREGSAAMARTSTWMRTLIAVLVLASLGAAWTFARATLRSYRKEREALETARRAIRQRDDLLGIVAHDLRNPLNAILMKAALLRRADGSPQTSAGAQKIEQIAKRMAGLIATLLDAATLEAGRLTLSPAPSNVGDLVREAGEMLANLAAERRVETVARNLTDPGSTVLADRDRVLQVFSNLLGNALKFTPDGGKIEVVAEDTAGGVRFTVSDSGPGIPPEHLPHLFDRFWKHETAGKKGTGLGLFISKGIVEGHGGRLWAESAEGQGARFIFSLPRPPVVAALRQAAAEVSPAP